MKRIWIAWILALSAASLSAQNEPFSNRVVRDERWEKTVFLPYAAGAVTVSDGGTYDAYNDGFNQNEAKALSFKLAGAIEAIEKSPPLSPPQGVDIKIRQINYVLPSPISGKPGLTGSIMMGFFALIQKDGDKFSGSETNTAVQVFFNDPGKIVNTPAVIDHIYIQPEKVGELWGQPVYFINGVESIVIHKKDTPPWLPVTKRECLAAIIDSLQNSIDKEKAARRVKGAGRPASDATDEGGAKRKESFVKAYEILLARDPEAAERLRKTFEEVEAGLSRASSKKKTNITPEETLSGVAGDLINRKARIERELNGMSAEERKRQAYKAYTGDNIKLSGRIYGLADRMVPGARPMVKINPALIDDDRPDSDIQLIAVKWTGAQPLSYSGGKNGYDLKGWKQVELSKDANAWNFIKEMMDPVIPQRSRTFFIHLSFSGTMAVFSPGDASASSSRQRA
ncbi:MAG TPA: hypothetical protein PLX50_03350 [Candidatus Aminicenantes bacterium]|nr:hypothetical protein [Candidatus Aminicenantes bacterium]